MTNTIEKIDEKIAMLDVLKDAIHNAECNLRCYSVTDEYGEEQVPTESYSLARYNAWQTVIKHLEKLI